MIPIGKVLRTHGYNGKMRISFEPAYYEDIIALPGVFIDVKGLGKLPFIFSHKEIISEKEALVSLEEISSLETARPLCGQVIYAREEDVTQAIAGNPYLSFSGYTIVDLNKGKIGTIREILELPGQTLAGIEDKGKQVLVPLNDIFIKSVDRKKKLVNMELPEGLLELNQ